MEPLGLWISLKHFRRNRPIPNTLAAELHARKMQKSKTKEKKWLSEVSWDAIPRKCLSHPVVAENSVAHTIIVEHALQPRSVFAGESALA